MSIDPRMLSSFQPKEDIHSPDSRSPNSCNSEIFFTPELNIQKSSQPYETDGFTDLYALIYDVMIENMKQMRLLKTNESGLFQEKTKSNGTKLSINIDILKLWLQNANTNDGLMKIPDRSWIENHLLKNCNSYSDFSPLHVAVIKKDINEIIKILAHRSEPVLKEMIEKKDSNDLTPLHWAVILGDKASLKTILNLIASENRLSFLNMEDKRGRTVFRWAIEKQDEDLINIIFSHLSDTDGSFLVMKKDNFERTSVHYAIESGNNVLVELLLNQVSAERDTADLCLSKDSSGQTIFHLAASCLDAKTFERLLELIPDKSKRSEVLQEKDNLNQTPLHKAARGSNEQLIKVIMRNILVEGKQRYLSEQDSDMKTALHLAISDGVYESVSFLLDEKDSNDLKSYLMTKDIKGKTAFHHLFYGDDRVNKLKCLFQKIKKCSKNKTKASKNVKEVLSDCDNDKRSILHYSIIMGDVALFKEILNQFNEDEKAKKNKLLSLEDKYGMNTLAHLFDLSQEVSEMLQVDGRVELRLEVMKSFSENYI